MYDNEHGRHIKMIMDNILARSVRHDNEITETRFEPAIDNGGDRMNFDEITPDDYHKAKLGRTLGGAKPKKSVAVYEPVDEANFEGEGAPRGNKNARPWIEHVQDYRAKHKCSYKDALKGAKSSYVPSGSTKGSKPVKKEVKVEEVKEPEPRRGTRVRKAKVVGSGLLLREEMRPSSMFGGKKTSSWIQHVQSYAKTHGCSYKEAMTKAKSTYKK